MRILIVICITLFNVFYNGASIKALDIEESFRYRLLNVYPHDSGAQTEGLIYKDGFLYEGTGPCRNGPSSLRKIEIKTGSILRIHELPESLFGEGITIFKNKIIQLTYTSKTGFVYELETFKLLGKFNYRTQGWGLTNDGTNLIMSDGTDTLYFLDPETFEEVKRIKVYDMENHPVSRINELEYIKGEIYANIFQISNIIRISPKTGRVTGLIDLSILIKPNVNIHDFSSPANGIAYDPVNDRIFITGKYWPELFEIEILCK